MDKKLNTPKVREAADSKGLNQTAIASALEVTRASVSKWFKGKSFPRPAELLKLGRLLGLSHRDLVERVIPPDEPLVAFRKRGACLTTNEHVERAKDMGRFLRPLVPYLDVDPFIGPPSLKNPSCDYRYLQELAARIRRELNIAEIAAFDFTDLIGLFDNYQAVIIPTLWGKKTRHENAIHIHLPESQTTWIYLNLDVEIHDFKFWMAHELGHVLTIDLLRENKINEAEDFADAFAGALLFPEPLAKAALADYKKARTGQGRLKVLLKWAEAQMISPNSVYKEIEKFADATVEPFTQIDNHALHASIAIFHKKFPTLSEHLFDGRRPTADHFMRVIQEAFGTRAYSALSRYVQEKEPGAGAIATILGVNRMDASAYLEAFSA
jgi:transcriptional regulator with XRE-family HTH domain/Zn-dependent peptidase ImmA (M78 family)